MQKILNHSQERLNAGVIRYLLVLETNSMRRRMVEEAESVQKNHLHSYLHTRASKNHIGHRLCYALL